MTDIINGDIYRYFGTEEALIEASHITNLKTGERVELSMMQNFYTCVCASVITSLPRPALAAIKGFTMTTLKS